MDKNSPHNYEYQIPIGEIVQIHQSLVKLTRIRDFKLDYLNGVRVLNAITEMEPHVIQFGAEHNLLLQKYGDQVVSDSDQTTTSAESQSVEYKIRKEYSETFNKEFQELRDRTITVRIVPLDLGYLTDIRMTLKEIELLSTISPTSLEKYKIVES